MTATKNKTAKIFMNGRSQAVRLPKDFRFDCDDGMRFLLYWIS